MVNPMKRITRLLLGEPTKPQSLKPQSGGIAPRYFDQRTKDQSAKYRIIYEQGGCVSEAFDSYPLFMLSNGYRFEGYSPAEEAHVRQALEDVDFESTIFKLCADSFVVGKGLAEMAGSVDGTEPLSALWYRLPEQFTENRDNYDRIVGYTQRVGMGTGQTKMVDAKVMLRIDLGVHLMARAYDDIVRDTMIAEGTAKSIERHGYPRYHVKVGQPGEFPPEDDIKAVGKEFENLKPQHEMATNAGVDIVNIDNQGVPNAKLYGEWATMRLVSAVGVPEELMGLGRGSTEATANVKLQAWYDKIGTFQRRLASQLNRQLFSRFYKGKGKIIFNDVSPSDDKLLAEYISIVMQANQIEPIMTRDEARAKLGLKPDSEPIPPPPTDDEDMAVEKTPKAMEGKDHDRGTGKSGLEIGVVDTQVSRPRRTNRKGAKSRS